MNRSSKALFLAVVAAVAAATFAATSAVAQLAARPTLIPFTVLLTGGQEVPANASKALGLGFLTLDERTDMLSFSITYTDEKLGGPETLTHLHGPAMPGANAAVVFSLILGNPKTGSVGPLTLQQKEDLKNGLFYVNIHSLQNAGGELRGQVLPAGRALVYELPEPVVVPPPVPVPAAP